jgi:hypothetical protein
MTPREILKQLSAVRKLPVAREVARRAGSSVTCTTLLTLYNLSHGECIKGDRYKTHRQKLLAAGYIVSMNCPEGTRAANNKPLQVYRITRSGKAAITKLHSELAKISERIRRKDEL